MWTAQRLSVASGYGCYIELTKPASGVTQVGLLSGEPGESLFSEPLLRYFKQNPLPEFFRKTELLHDDRLIAIVTALIVESLLDELHGAFLPRYKKLIENNEFTFSLKIRLAESLSLIPPSILRTTDILRRFRNEFAHNLDIVTFEQCPDKLQNQLTTARSNAYARFGKDSAAALPSLNDEFKGLAFYCIVGLESYRENHKTLGAHLEEPDFVSRLTTQVRAEEETLMREILSKPPISVEERGHQRIERYEGGVVNIIGLRDGDTIELQ